MVPNIRVKGFNGDWEVRSLGEIYTERNERGDDSLQILSVSIHDGVSDGELDEEGLGKVVRRSEDKTTYKHVYEGDLVFNMMRAWQGAIGVVKTEGMISPAYISAIPNENVYPPFMDYTLRRKEAISQINNLSYGVTDFRKRLYWDSFVKVRCSLPSVKEQRKIADTLEGLDEYILLSRKQCDDLIELKKYMLQKMFPKDGEKVPEIRFSGFEGEWEQRKLGDLVQFSKGSGYSKGDLQESGAPIILYGMAKATDKFLEQLQRLKRRGFRLWLDDFGSGYSSLNVFTRFEVDLIKFDMDLLRKLDDRGGVNRKIMKSMTQIAREMGIHTLTNTFGYTVTWKNSNSTQETLETDENVLYGTKPEYNGATPTRPADDSATKYTFIGWKPEITEITTVTGNVTYRAKYVSAAVELYIQDQSSATPVSIEGAKFTLTNSNGEVVWTGTSGADGLLYINKISAEGPGSDGAVFANGSTYTLSQTETKEPDYFCPQGSWTLSVSDSGVFSMRANKASPLDYSTIKPVGP